MILLGSSAHNTFFVGKSKPRVGTRSTSAGLDTLHGHHSFAPFLGVVLPYLAHAILQATLSNEARVLIVMLR